MKRPVFVTFVTRLLQGDVTRLSCAGSTTYIQKNGLVTLLRAVYPLEPEETGKVISLLRFWA